jgi:hypothetical protein
MASSPQHSRQRLHAALERAANLTQEAYLQFRENTWHTFVGEVQLEGNEVVVMVGTSTNRRPFQRFPSERINVGLKAAVLTHGTRSEALYT